MGTIDDLCQRAGEALADPKAPLLDPVAAGESAPLAELVNELIAQNRQLAAQNRKATNYIRAKVNQLLTVMGTLPLRSEELDDASLIQTDPIGIVAESFIQILGHLRRTNSKLEAAMDEIQTIFEAVGAGIMVLDNDGRILSCNHAFNEMFVTDGESLIGTQCRESVCQVQEVSRATCPHQEMLLTGKTSVVPNGHIRGHEVTIVASPVKDKQGTITHSVLLYTDISALKAAESELAAEKELLRITLQSIAEGVITSDVDGRIVLLNEVAELLTGWSQEEAQGKPVCEVFWLITDSNRQDCINITSEALKAGAVSLDTTSEAILVSQDGSERWISLNAATIESMAGDIQGVVVAFRDITAEKTMEAEVQKARKIESLGVLAGGIAHDFNNILTGIVGNISLAKMLSPPDSRAVETLSRAESACHRAQGLTHQLLTFAKGGAPIRKTISVVDLITETAVFSLRGSNVRCDLRIDEDLWMAYVDAGQISQVMSNMVLNADQAMPGGGLITVAAKNCELGADATVPVKPGKYIVVTITDAGCGIGQEMQERIFDPYFTTKAKGSGLGLASSYAIVKKHEGHIEVHSTPGRGSTFTVYLPARMQDPPPASSDGPKPAAELGPLKILVMDDEEMILELAREMLLTLGCREVDSARDGDQAIDLYRLAMEIGKPYDLAILDLTIPGGMGGKETIKHLVALDPDVKAIVSSGYSSDASMSSYRLFGFQAVIPKPYQVSQLISAIQSVMTVHSPTRSAV